MNTQLIPLEPEKYYHIYNRSNDGCLIFYEDNNYSYFLRKISEYISDYIDIYAYCLLPNHFHFLIRMKKDMEIKNLFLASLSSEKKASDLSSSQIVSEQFRRFFLSYSKSINKQEKRHGSLFQKYFKRKQIDSDNYFKQLIFYIHHNPAHHEITEKFKNYKWSSYFKILDDKPTKLMKNETIEFFGSKSEYIQYHDYLHDISEIKDLLVE